MQDIQSLISVIEIPQLIDITFCIILLRISLIDIRLKLIYNKYTVSLFVAGAIINILHTQYDAVMWGIACGAILWGIGALYGGGMGCGDVKLMCAIGTWIGNEYSMLSIFIAFISGGIAALVLLVLYGNRARHFKIPFAPFLTIGAITVLLWGEELWSWYWAIV